MKKDIGEKLQSTIMSKKNNYFDHIQMSQHLFRINNTND